MIEGFKMPNLVNEYKTIFLDKRGKPWNSSKTFSYILVSYKFVLKPVKGLNPILSVGNNGWRL